MLYTTDVLQSLDKCYFEQLKTQQEKHKRLVESQCLSNGGKISNKACFKELVYKYKIWPSVFTASNIMAVFKATGICPSIAPNIQYKDCESGCLLYKMHKTCQQKELFLQPHPTILLQQLYPIILIGLLTVTSNNLEYNSDQQYNNTRIPDSVKDCVSTAVSPTFEDILSRRLRQTPCVPKSETRKKIDTNSAVITSKDFLSFVAACEQGIGEEAALKAPWIVAKGKKKCVIKKKESLEETD